MSNPSESSDSRPARADSHAPVRPVLGVGGRPRGARKARQTLESRRVIHHPRRK